MNKYDAIRKLAKGLDDFMFNYDFYGYLDVIEDREDSLKLLTLKLKNGDTELLIDYLNEIIEKNTHMAAEAKKLIYIIKNL